MGKHQLAAGELVAAAGEGVEVEMPADRRGTVALAQEQVDVVGGGQQRVGPLGVPRVGHRGIWPVDAQRVRRCAGGMAHLERGDAQRAQFDRMTIDVLGDADGEAALHTARPGEQDLHRLLEPGTGAGWAEDGEVVGTAAELRVEHQERQATEVVAVQVGDQHRLDLVGVDLLLAQRGQAGRSAVQQHAGCVDLVGSQGDAGLEPATGAERIAAARRRHTHDAIIPPGGSREGRIMAGRGWSYET